MSDTDELARTKQCCVTGCGKTDPIHDSTGIRYCIGSQCMGWRWTEIMIDGRDSYISEPGPKGYCGRAGLPLELQ